MEVQIVLTFGILIAGLIYETTMFVFRKIKEGEKFDIQKYALTYGYVALLAVSTYLITGAFPAVQDIIIQLGDQIPEVTTVFTLLMTVAIGIVQKFLKGSVTPTISAVPQEPVSEPVAPQPPFPVGKGVILGIYGGSARSNPPQKSFTCDVNQVPTMFFDFIGTVTGKVMYQVLIDNVAVAEAQGISVSNVGVVQTFDFWIPQKFRVAGTHTVNIRTGYVPSENVVKWTGNNLFELVFTGVKPLE